MSFEQSFEYLLGWEGGFGNDPRDPGGATNLGVIQEEYDRCREQKGCLPQSVSHITRAEAEEIYRAKYWNEVRCDEFNPGVANALFDASVNSGPTRGVRWLQQAINQLSGHEAVAVDASCGPLTIAAANAMEPNKLIDAMLVLRLAFMKVAKNPKTGAALWPTFGNGWSARINGVRKQSHALAGLPAPSKSLPQAQEKTSMSWIPLILANAQIQSLFRTVLKIAGTALVVKAGGDVGSVDTIVGAIVTLIGAFGSITIHSPTANPTQTAA